MAGPILHPLVEIVLKAAVLLACGGLGALTLRRAPARVRGAVLAAALVGSLLVPLCTRMVPVWQVPLPWQPALVEGLPAAATEWSGAVGADDGPVRAIDDTAGSISGASASTVAYRAAGAGRHGIDGLAWSAVAWASVLVAAWALGALAVLVWQVAGCLSVRAMVRRGATVQDPSWLCLLSRESAVVGLDAPPGLVLTDELTSPAAWGLWRPTVLLPLAAECWIHERREVVLRHELVHVARRDWGVRSLARLACAVYWFNPLVWWAWHRLVEEQELACDHEVIALGSRPSTYASHLLSLARASRPRVAIAGAALEMARRSRMEGRIMSILDPDRARRVGRRAVISAALLTLALAPAIAAVQPSSLGPAATTSGVARAASSSQGAETAAAPASASAATSASPRLEQTVKASPRIKQTVAEMREVEKQLQAEAERMREVEASMKPQLEEIERLGKALEHEHQAVASEAIEERLRPYREQLRQLEEEMEPLHRKMAEAAAAFGPSEARMEQTEVDMAPVREELEKLSREIAAADDRMAMGEAIQRLTQLMEPLTESMQKVHQEMAPHQERLEALRREMEPYHQRMEEIHRQMEPVREDLERLHESMRPEMDRLRAAEEQLRPFHKQMREAERALRPYSDKLETLAATLREELQVIVRARLEQHIGTFVSAEAPWDEAAARLVAGSHSIDLDDASVLELRLPRSETRTILTDLMGPARRPGVSEAQLKAGITAAVEAIAELEVELD